MPGITKRKYDAELIRFNKSLNKPLNNIKSVLPYDYTYNDILRLFVELYPYEWDIIQQRTKQYKAKDNFLNKIGKKIRYKPIASEYYLSKLQKVKHMLLEGQKKLHKNFFNEQDCTHKLTILQKQTEIRMLKIKKQYEDAKKFIQTVEPLYIDIFIHSYHSHNATIAHKMEIVKELQKYESEKTLEFFQKLNDSEKNTQIRKLAFDHLQKIGCHVKLRKGFKGKKKPYMIEITNFDEMKPLDLLQRIEKDTIQNKKIFDYFISHSYKDNELVQKIVKAMNKLKLNVYCDWLSDNDFLKRKYASEYTKTVLKYRINQSKKILFIRTSNTNDFENNFSSEWIEMEILYAKELHKDIECIDLLKDKQCEFKLFDGLEGKVNGSI